MDTIHKNIMIFDLGTEGHHAGYILHLLRYCPDWVNSVTVVVSPKFLQEHDNVVQTVTRTHVTWLPINPVESQAYEDSKKSLISQTQTEWSLFCRYAKKIDAYQGVVMYIDRFQLPLALRLPLPCYLSGIYFRPRFHYNQLEHPASVMDGSSRNRPIRNRFVAQARLHAICQKWLCQMAFCHPKLRTLLCLDPLAVEPLQRLSGQTQVIYLPDPVEKYTPSNMTRSLHQKLAIDPRRKVFLLFGVLSKRKGIYQILDALCLLTESQQKETTLLLVGPIAEADKAQIKREVDAVISDTWVQIIIDEQFVFDEAIHPYFTLSDVILALYQWHVGTSSILIRAAAAGKPILSSDYGLMGEWTRQYSLGIALDSTNPDIISQGLSTYLAGLPEQIFDRDLAAEFACLNSAELFAETVWESVADDLQYKK